MHSFIIHARLNSLDLLIFNIFAAFRYICDQADRVDILRFFIMLDLLTIMLTILMSTIPDLLTFINTFIIIEPYCYFMCPMY